MRPLPLPCALLSCTLLCGHGAMAIDQVTFRAARVDAPAGVVLRSLRAQLALPDQAAPRLESTVASLQATALPGTWQQLQLRCGSLLLQQPHWQCGAAMLRIGQSPLGPLQAELAVHLDSSRDRTELELARAPVAGGQLRLRARAEGLRWQIEDASLDTQLPPLAEWLQRWWQPPPGFQFTGHVSLRADAAGDGLHLDRATLQAQLRGLNLQNQAGTLVTEKVDADVGVQLQGTLQQPTGSLQVSSQAGQALAGPALLDFAAHPLQLRSNLAYAAGTLALRDLQVTSTGLATARGDAQLVLAPAPSVRSLRIDVTRLEFPAAYTSFLQLPLAATEFGNLEARGSVRAQLQLIDDRLASLDIDTGDGTLQFDDTTKGLALQGLQGEFHWLPRAAREVAVTRLRWQGARAFGLRGGAAALQLRVQGDQLQLVEPVRVPLFDGALAVQRFEAQRLGSADVSLAFDGHIETIGMPELSRAFGWPEMAGTLSGRLPGLEYRGGTLSVAGDISAQVFDGTIVASGLRLRDVFGRFPRFSGNFTARRLDLGLITRTFPIGSITGRLDADVRGLELFGWQAVAFDAQLVTTPGDRTRHRISQRAVGNLANLGGGGGGVTAALQSGFLRFFKDFGYDRIGLRCQLRNDVCLMDGIARPEGGFYIVKGGGLPRLDVIGTSGRIAWSQLVSQIGAAVETGQVEVR